MVAAIETVIGVTATVTVIEGVTAEVIAIADVARAPAAAARAPATAIGVAVVAAAVPVVSAIHVDRVVVAEAAIATATSAEAATRVGQATRSPRMSHCGRAKDPIPSSDESSCAPGAQRPARFQDFTPSGWMSLRGRSVATQDRLQPLGSHC